MKRQRYHENEDTGSHNQKDMLSELPDSVLTHILSFLKTKDAIQTCLLSTRWKHLWKRIPTLEIYSKHFRTSESFAEFVNQVLSLRDASAVNALDFHSSYGVNPDLVESIVRYAVSHNLNRLHLFSDIRQFPLSSLFSCLSLTSLELFLGFQHEFPNSLNLPALNYLKLYAFSFCSANDGRIEPFSTFNKLSTLILKGCSVRHAQTLCISNTNLLNLSIHLGYSYKTSKLLELSAPNLCSFTFIGRLFHKLYGSSLDSIKEARFDVHMALEPSNHAHTTLILLNWLIQLVNIKSLTVSAATLRILSLTLDILKMKPPSWNNLESLKVKRDRDVFSMIRQRDVNLELGDKSGKKDAKLREANIPDGIIEFLLQNSPSVKVDIVD